MLNSNRTADAGKPMLYMSTETLHPNKLSGAYIISIVTRLPRSDFWIIEFTRYLRTKIYKRGIYHYICPFIGQQPPEGYRWILIGRSNRREVWRAI